MWDNTIEQILEVLEKLKQRELINTECLIIKSALNFFSKLQTFAF